MDVAIKIMLFQNTPEDIARQLVLREAAVCCSMSHPNVVATYHFEVLKASAFHTTPSGMEIMDESGERAFKLYLIQVLWLRGRYVARRVLGVGAFKLSLIQKGHPGYTGSYLCCSNRVAGFGGLAFSPTGAFEFHNKLVRHDHNQLVSLIGCGGSST